MTRRATYGANARNGVCPAQPFDAHIHAHGWCAICRHRDQARHHGAAFCAGNFRRQHPTCTHDQRQPRFALDLQALKAIGATP